MSAPVAALVLGAALGAVVVQLLNNIRVFRLQDQVIELRWRLSRKA